MWTPYLSMMEHYFSSNVENVVKGHYSWSQLGYRQPSDPFWRFWVCLDPHLFSRTFPHLWLGLTHDVFTVHYGSRNSTWFLQKKNSTANKKFKTRDTDIENKHMDTKVGKGRWDKLGDWDQHVYTNM